MSHFLRRQLETDLEVAMEEAVGISGFVNLLLYVGLGVGGFIGLVAFIGWRRSNNLTRLTE